MTQTSKLRMLLLGAAPGKWSSAERKDSGEIETGIDAWVYAFNGDYLQIDCARNEDMKKYDLIIANSNYTDGKLFLKQIELASNRGNGAKWVTLIEGCASDYIRPMKYLRELFSVADLVNVINKHSLSLFESLTETKVIYLGIPYPFEGIKKFFVPFEKRNKSAFICPRLLNRMNDYLVAKSLGLNYYGYERQIPRKWRNIPKLITEYGSINRNAPINKAKKLYHDSQLEIRSEIYGPSFYKDNANSWLWLNLDERYTWGRYVLDAAALQIPIITTQSTGHGDVFFPQTTLKDEFQIDQAIKIGMQLCKDEEFYRHVATIPEAGLLELSHDAMREKLIKSLFSTVNN